MNRDDSSKSPDRKNIILLMLLTLVSRTLLRYVDGMGDPDSVVMAAGMAWSLTSDVPFAETMLYGRHVGPGIYYIVHVVYPLFFSSAVHMIGFLNWVSILSATLLVWPMYGVVRGYLSPHASAGTVTLFIFSPIVWDAGTYFHPLLPASLLLFTAIVTYRRIDMSGRGILYLCLTTLLATCALVIRTELLIITPGIAVAALVSRERLRNMLNIGAIGLVAILVYVLVQRVTPSAGFVSSYSVSDYVRRLADMYVSTMTLSGVTKSLTWMTMGVGIATIGMVFYVAVRFRGSDEKKMIAAAVAWALPAILFWLPQPIPILRHYYLAVFGIVALIGLVALKPMTASRTRVVVAIMVATTIFVPEIVYRTYNRSNPSDTKWANGSVFYYHQQVDDHIARFRDTARDLVEGVANGSTTEILIRTNWSGYAYVMQQMASSGLGLTQVMSNTVASYVSIDVYRLGEVTITNINALYLDGRENLPVIDATINDAIAAGKTVILPREFPSERLIGRNVIRY